jgi:hypothetical protein
MWILLLFCARFLWPRLTPQAAREYEVTPKPVANGRTTRKDIYYTSPQLCRMITCRAIRRGYILNGSEEMNK